MRMLRITILILSVFMAGLVLAQEGIEGVNFPVPELGNCANQEECRVFCDQPENMEPCIVFAEEHNLLPKEEIEMAKKMIELEEEEGPGGCLGKTECEAYCDDISNIEECVAFAEKYNLIPPEELEEAKKIIAAIKKGAIPPPCSNKKECDIYCSEPEHMETCINFAATAGLIPPEELEDANKVLQAIQKGVKPPPCNGKEACDEYCSQPEHIEECVAFAEAAGFISPEEVLMMKQTGGKGPGGCRGKEVCRAYCDDPSHMEECIDFGLKYGFISEEEAANAKKMLEAGLFSGPGGCKEKEECDAYCNELSHMEECIDFSVKAGFMTPEEAENSKKMIQMGATTGPGNCSSKEECDVYCSTPENMEECMEFGEKMGIIKPEEKEMMEGMIMGGGPGGCKSKEECEAYCQDPAHNEECFNFGVEKGFIGPEIKPPSGEMPPIEGGMPPEGGYMGPGEYMGPGGCKNVEECTQYCSQPEHIEECQKDISSPPIPEEYKSAPPEIISPPEEYIGPPSSEEIKLPEEIMPPQEEIPVPPLPQSFLDILPKFFGNIVSAFLGLR